MLDAQQKKNEAIAEQLRQERRGVTSAQKNKDQYKHKLRRRFYQSIDAGDFSNTPLKKEGKKISTYKNANKAYM